MEKFKEKVDLAIARHKTISSYKSLASEVGLASDYVSRMVNGSRPLTQEHLQRFTEALDVPVDAWFQELREFASSIGVDRRELSRLTGAAEVGFDFQARLRERSLIKRLHALIGGYWESYYCSVSRTDELVASRDLIHFGDPTDDGIIPCTVRDVYFEYEGVCFPVQHHLYVSRQEEAA